MRLDLAILLGLVGVALLSMPIYVRFVARDRYAAESARRGSFVLGSFVQEWFYWFIRPVEVASLAVGLRPLFYNVLGVLFGISAGVAFATGHLVAGGWGILLGGVADILDGRVARALGLASDQGAFLDSTLDRFAEVGAFVGLAVLYRDSGPAVAVVAAALGGSLLVSYARARGESVGVLCRKGVMQRAERLLTVGFGGLLDPSITEAIGWPPGVLLLGLVALVAVGTVGTALYRTIWIARRLDPSAGPPEDEDRTPHT